MSSAPKKVSVQVVKFATRPASRWRRKLVAEGGSPTRRRKWRASLATVIVALSSVSGGTLMLMGSPTEMAQDAYRSAGAVMQRLTARENAETEAAARNAAEEKLAVVAAARQEEARRAAEEKAPAEAAREMADAQDRAAAEEAAKRQAAEEAAKRQAAEEVPPTPAEAALEATDGKPKSDAEVEEQGGGAKADLNLSDQDRKQAQEPLPAPGHEIPTATDRFGTRTRAMIKAWQKRQGLPETGFLDESQLVALLEQATLARRADETELDVRQRAEKAEAGLQLSEHDRKEVQVALNSLGHEIPTATGYFGSRTRAMIKTWQKTQGLAETGYLTEAQLATLREQAAAALAKYNQAQRRVKEDPHGTR